MERKENEMQKVLAVVFGLILACGVLLPAAHATEWNEKSELTFSQPVQIPHMVLPAGTYWFILARSQSNRNVVEIYNKNWTKLYATTITVPAYRLNSTDRTEVTFAERPSNRPEALLKWYYPGRLAGHEFLYSPRQEHRFANDIQINDVAPHLKTRS
jgi:hypothetical protein